MLDMLVAWFASALAGIASAIRAMRAISHKQMLNYDPAQDCLLGASQVEVFSIEADPTGVRIPKIAGAPISAWLELDVQATFFGAFNDPALRLTSDIASDTQAVEQRAAGRRFFNVTRFLRSNDFSNPIVLAPTHMNLRSRAAWLHVSHFSLSDQDRVLVIAPHPDDAEIGSFGLYADTDSTIVTITAGQGSDHYRRSAAGESLIPAPLVARLRVIDSIVVPWLGGVNPSKAVNLCFPDAQLIEMERDPDRDFAAALGGARSFESLRGLNRSELLRAAASCTWRGLVADLARIIETSKPTIIVAPHPLLDDHPDHFCSTLAMCQALQSVTVDVRAILFTCVHNRRSELWPFGAAGDGYIALPVLAEDGEAGESIYSHSLSSDRQKLKFLALEAMHDLREIDWSAVDGADNLRERLLKEARKLIHGPGGSPTSYFRRAIRPDEVFFVSSINHARRLIQRALVNCHEARAAALL